MSSLDLNKHLALDLAHLLLHALESTTALLLIPRPPHPPPRPKCQDDDGDGDGDGDDSGGENLGYDQDAHYNYFNY